VLSWQHGWGSNALYGASRRPGARRRRGPLVAIMGRADWWLPRALARAMRIPEISDTDVRVLKATDSYGSSDLEDTAYPDVSGWRI